MLYAGTKYSGVWSRPAQNISVAPWSYDFGNVVIGSSSIPKTFTISTKGNEDRVIGSLSITNTDASEFDIQNDNCSGQTFAPSCTCTVDVIFSPTSTGPKSANLAIPSNDPDTPILNVKLRGEGRVVAIVYNINTGKNFWTIQEAIDDPDTKDGHTIIVKSDIYREEVNVNKQLILRGVDTGGGKPVVDAGGIGTPITLNKDRITLEGFEVRNSGKWRAGIEVNSNYNTISNNTCSVWCGIYLGSSNNNDISNNSFVSNGCSGVQLEGSSNNVIFNNTFSSNNNNGILLEYSSNNIISNNNFLNKGNCGINSFYSNNNIIYLNDFINNTNNVYSEDSTNIWNSGSKMTYTYNSNQYTNYMGNYWCDHTGSDADGDGIADIPYSIDSDTDNYPLLVLWECYFAPTATVSIKTEK